MQLINAMLIVVLCHIKLRGLENDYHWYINMHVRILCWQEIKKKKRIFFNVNCSVWEKCDGRKMKANCCVLIIRPSICFYFYFRKSNYPNLISISMTEIFYIMISRLRSRRRRRATTGRNIKMESFGLICV